MLLQIVCPGKRSFVAGIIVVDGAPVKNNICAPIIKYMKNWDLQRIVDYCGFKEWTITVLNKQ